MIILLLLDLINIILSATAVPVFALTSDVLTTGLTFLSSNGWVLSIIAPALSFFAYILGSASSVAFIFTISVALIPIEIAASIIWWVLGKLPFINIQKR